MAKQSVTVTVNGTRYQRDIEPRLLLSDFIRHELSLTGTHVGCEHGVCGTCTVLLEGLATRSCLCLAVQADGLSVETVESLGKVGALHPLQQAFWEKHGLQCGFCTSGMLMSVVELLRVNPAPIARPSSRRSAATCAAAPDTRILLRQSSAPSNC